MRLSHHDCVLIYRELETLSQKKALSRLHHLSQEEREVVRVALSNIRAPIYRTTDLSDISIEPILQKLHQKSLERPCFFIRVMKTLASVLGLRISSRQVRSLLERTQTDYSKYSRAVSELPPRIAALESEIAALKAIKVFKIEKAYPEYIELASFYEQLLTCTNEAKAHLDERIKALQVVIQRSKESGVDKDFIYILEKEILASLVKLHKYKGDHFTRELELSSQAFKKAANSCRDFTLEDQAIAESCHKLYQMEAALTTAQRFIEPIRRFENLESSKPNMMKRLEALPNPVLQHNVLTYLEDHFVHSEKQSQQFVLEMPIESFSEAETDPEKIVFEWEKRVKEARIHLWDTKVAKERGFLERNACQGYVRSMFVHQAYEKDLHMPFCHPMPYIGENTYAIAFATLFSKLPQTFLSALNNQIDKALTQLLKSFSEKGLEKARADFIKSIETKGSEEERQQALAIFDQEMALAQERHLQSEKKVNLGLNLLGLGRCLRDTEIGSQIVKTWQPQIQNIQDLKSRGIESLTHLKVLGQMFSLAMNQLKTELPQFTLENENDLISLGVYDRESLCAFLIKERESLSDELKQLFEAVLGYSI